MNYVIVMAACACYGWIAGMVGSGLGWESWKSMVIGGLGGAIIVLAANAAGYLP